MLKKTIIELDQAEIESLGARQEIEITTKDGNKIVIKKEEEELE